MVQNLWAMYATIPVETASKTLQIGIGFASHQDAIWAAVRATAMARSGLHGTSPDLVLLVTAGVPAQDVVPMIRGVLGPVGVAGGATSAILTHNGAVTAGALVVCLTNSEGAVSGVAAAGGRDLTEAGRGAARRHPPRRARRVGGPPGPRPPVGEPGFWNAPGALPPPRGGFFGAQKR